MLKIIRVEEAAKKIQIHKVKVNSSMFSHEYKYCSHVLCKNFDSHGNFSPGRSSRICQHGYLICTDQFTVEFPILIEGGLSNASSY